MIEHFYPEVYVSGKITHKQLYEAHGKFMGLRAVDKKYKVGWPIWLLSSNTVSRGVYQLPSPINVEDEEDMLPLPHQDTPEYREYDAELKDFGVR